MQAGEGVRVRRLGRQKEHAAGIRELFGDEVAIFRQRCVPDDERGVVPRDLGGTRGRQNAACILARRVCGGFERGLQRREVGLVVADDHAAQHGRLGEDKVEDVVAWRGIGGQFDAAVALLHRFGDGDGVRLQNELRVLHLGFEGRADIAHDEAQRQFERFLGRIRPRDAHIEQQLGFLGRFASRDALDGDAQILRGGLGIRQQMKAHAFEAGEAAAQCLPASATGIPVALTQVAEHPHVGAAGLIRGDVIERTLQQRRHIRARVRGAGDRQIGQ